MLNDQSDGVCDGEVGFNINGAVMEEMICRFQQVLNSGL
jgi:hypothetical protein